MSERFTYPKPAKPQIVRDLDDMHRAFNRGLRATDRGNVVDGLLLATRALIGELEIAQALTDEEREQVAEYNRQVAEYNRQVAAYRERVAAWRREQQAKRRTAQVRAARCGKCFTVHGKGQEECW